MQSTDLDIKHKQVQVNLIGQIIGIVFGFYFVLSDSSYEGIQFIIAIICSPFIFAGLIRFIISSFRIIRRLTAHRIYSDSGECIGMAPRPILPVLATILAVMLLVTGIIGLFNTTVFICYTVLILIFALVVYLLVKDVRIWIAFRKEKNSTVH